MKEAWVNLHCRICEISKLLPLQIFLYRDWEFKYKKFYFLTIAFHLPLNFSMLCTRINTPAVQKLLQEELGKNKFSHKFFCRVFFQSVLSADFCFALCVGMQSTELRAMRVDLFDVPGTTWSLKQFSSLDQTIYIIDLA